MHNILNDKTKYLKCLTTIKTLGLKFLVLFEGLFWIGIIRHIKILKNKKFLACCPEKLL